MEARYSSLSDRTRARLIAAAGILIILLSAGSALLPFAERVSGSRILGSLLVLAGVIEMLAGTLRRLVRIEAMTAGAVTLFAGLLFILNPTLHLIPTVYVISGWLVLRSFILIVASTSAGGSVRIWPSLSAAMNLILAVVLLLGLQIATFVIALFGPTAPLIASFAWVLALSFVVTGTLMLEVASCERESTEQ